jgi:hypothetical protein
MALWQRETSATNRTTWFINWVFNLFLEGAWFQKHVLILFEGMMIPNDTDNMYIRGVEATNK